MRLFLMLLVMVASSTPALTLDPPTFDLPPGQARSVTITNDSTSPVHIQATQNPLSVALDAVILPPPKPVTKWFPGHYQTVKSAAYAGANAWDREPFRTALRHPQMSGLLLTINWRELEPTRGAYDFTQIEAALDAVGGVGKHLWFKVQDRSFQNQAGGNMPDYVTSEGCTFNMPDQNTPNPADIKGRALKWYIPRCVDHFIRLYTALGSRFEKDPRLWAVTVGDGESALSGAPQQPDYTSPTIHIDQIIRATEESKKAFPTTLVATGINMLPDSKQFSRIGDALVRIGGCAFTHPDTIPGKVMGGTIEERRMRGIVPTLAQGQQTAIDPNMPQAERKIFEWGLSNGISTLAWGDGWRGAGNYVTVRVIPFLNTPASNWPAEALACPKSAQPCSP